MADRTQEKKEMKITITIQNCVDNRKINIQVDNKQRIATTFRVLEENMPDIMWELKEPFAVKSQRSKRRLNLYKNYEQEMIFNGDIIMLYNE